MPKTPSTVEPLIQHLRATGTGAEKLTAVATVAERCSSLKEFVTEVKSAVPSGTFAKIEEYVADNQPATAPSTPTPAAALPPPPARTPKPEK